MRLLTIGQVARQAEIGVETVRFYERKGLIEESGEHPATGSTTKWSWIACGSSQRRRNLASR